MSKRLRTYLVIADENPEMDIALRYAIHRATLTQDRVALLAVIETQVIQTWSGIEDIFTEQETQSASATFKAHEEEIEEATGHPPLLFLRRGDVKTALLFLLENQPDISVLVLGAATGAKGPGPLVQFLTSAKGIKQLKIPLVIVPDTYKVDGEAILV